MEIFVVIVIMYIIGVIFFMNYAPEDCGDVKEWLWNIGIIGACALSVVIFSVMEDIIITGGRLPVLEGIMEIMTLLLIGVPFLLFRFKSRYVCTAGIFFIALIDIFGSESYGNNYAILVYLAVAAVFGFIIRKKQNFSMIFLIFLAIWTAVSCTLFGCLGWTDDCYRSSNLLGAMAVLVLTITATVLSVPVNKVMNKILKKLPQRKIAAFYIPAILGILTLTSITGGVEQAVNYNTAKAAITVIRYEPQGDRYYATYTDTEGIEHKLIGLNTLIGLSDGDELKIAYSKEKAPADAMVYTNPEGTTETGYEDAKQYVYFFPIAALFGVLTALAVLVNVKMKKGKA